VGFTDALTNKIFLKRRKGRRCLKKIKRLIGRNFPFENAKKLWVN
jgi:hypothetical protein